MFLVLCGTSKMNPRKKFNKFQSTDSIQSVRFDCLAYQFVARAPPVVPGNRTVPVTNYRYLARRLVSLRL
jgi:hypothetical protein